MSPENDRMVIDWIMGKVPEWACTFCGGRQWAVGEVVMPPLANDLTKGSPQVIVQCAVCAYVHHFDAFAVGLRPPF